MFKRKITKPEGSHTIDSVVSLEKQGQISGLKRKQNEDNRALRVTIACAGSSEYVKRPRMSAFCSSKYGQSVGADQTKVDEESKSDADRLKVKEALKSFKEISKKLEQSGQKTWAAKAARILREQNGWVNISKRVGHVPGVDAGDRFTSRAELLVVGLHGHLVRGIDYIKTRDGSPLAISIVESGRYCTSISSPNELIYSGEGENPNVSGKKHPRDQKFVGGNLALKNSMDKKSPVRVIRRINLCTVGNKTDSVSWYFYDGLYSIDHIRRERGQYGKLVYRFKLRKITAQSPSEEKSELLSEKYSRAAETRGISSEVTRKECRRWEDLSHGKEKVPIPAVNTIDGENPPNFCYITEMIYPDVSSHSIPTCCSCTRGCSSLKKCLCAIKNGGELPYNKFGINLKNRFIYECGFFCKCSSSCTNRITQQGVKFHLEVFRKISKLGWAVRSLSSIPARSFVCEYVGEIFRENEAKTGSGCDKYMFDIKTLGLPSHSDLPKVSHGVEEGFTIDSRRFGNVGRFVNHSLSPNLFVQYVLHDHGDKRMPHVMLFALEDIHPQQELTLNYCSSKFSSVQENAKFSSELTA